MLRENRDGGVAERAANADAGRGPRAAFVLGLAAAFVVGAPAVVVAAPASVGTGHSASSASGAVGAALGARTSDDDEPEPGGPRVEEPGGPRMPAPPPPIDPGTARMPKPPPATPPVEDEDDEAKRRVFRGLLAVDLRFPFGNHGGVLAEREIDDSSGLSLSLGLLPNDKILLGVRGALAFGPMNRNGWGEALRGGVLSSTGFEIGPSMQLRFRLPATFLLYLGADGAYAQMRSTLAATLGTTFRGVTLATGDTFSIVYRGWAVGGTLGLAWRGISSELRYVRTEWTTIELADTALEASLATDQILLSIGFALRI